MEKSDPQLPYPVNPKAFHGMPLGSPGMEVEDRFSPYDVLVHYKDGSTKVYAEIRK